MNNNDKNIYVMEENFKENKLIPDKYIWFTFGINMLKSLIYIYTKTLTFTSSVLPQEIKTVKFPYNQQI